eukprot:SAG31_NODE_658_length_13104_cov_4.409919_3_plen_640_part_00
MAVVTSGGGVGNPPPSASIMRRRRLPLLPLLLAAASEMSAPETAWAARVAMYPAPPDYEPASLALAVHLLTAASSGGGGGSVGAGWVQQQRPVFVYTWCLFKAAPPQQRLKSDDELGAHDRREGALLHKGMHFLGKSFEGTYAYDDPRALQSLKNMASAGVTHVTFTFSWYLNMTTKNGTRTFPTGPINRVTGPAPSGVIYANASSPSDAELKTIIDAAHALNLTVKLRPAIDPDYRFAGGSCTTATAQECPGRGEIGGLGHHKAHYTPFTTSEWAEFFAADGNANYGDYLLHMAELAEQTKCAMLDVGVELNAAIPQEGHFRRLIAKVRKVFTGQLHLGMAGCDLQLCKFWDALDAVTCDAYPALTQGIAANVSNPSVEQLVAAFPPFLETLSAFYYGKPPPPPPAPSPAPPAPPAPPCPPVPIGGKVFNFSNTRPYSPTEPGSSNNHVQYLGNFSSDTECEAKCKASKDKHCSSWTWHDHDGSRWDGHCYRRSDGVWAPVFTTNDVSGRVSATEPELTTPPPAWFPAKVNMPIIWAENGGCSYNNMVSPPEQPVACDERALAADQTTRCWQSTQMRHPANFYHPDKPDPPCLECQGEVTAPASISVHSASESELPAALCRYTHSQLLRSVLSSSLVR